MSNTVSDTMIMCDDNISTVYNSTCTHVWLYITDHIHCLITTKLIQIWIATVEPLAISDHPQMTTNTGKHMLCRADFSWCVGSLKRNEVKIEVALLKYHTLSIFVWNY